MTVTCQVCKCSRRLAALQLVEGLALTENVLLQGLALLDFELSLISQLQLLHGVHGSKWGEGFLHADEESRVRVVLRIL